MHNNNNNTNNELRVQVYSRMSNVTGSSGCSSMAQGVRLSLRPDGQPHSFLFELSKRHIVPVFLAPLGLSTQTATSAAMLRQVGDPSFKCSLRHTYTWSSSSSSSSLSDGVDGDDGAATSTAKGKLLVKVSNELAGLGGDVCFLKSKAS